MGFFTDLFKKKDNKRKYEAASKKKRLRQWNPQGTSANTEIHLSLDVLRNRSRDLRRNNPLANKGIGVISSNVVGHGIKTKFQGTRAEEVQRAWNEWCNSTACDYNGMVNFYTMQKMIVEAVVESGEVLARKRINNQMELPLQYQILESDFLATSVTPSKKDDKPKTVMQGVELDKNGRVVKYHLYETHPGDWASLGTYRLPKDLKINSYDKDEIHHVFRMDRPGQLRGVPWLAPVMIRLKDMDEFIDATLMKQKVAACFAGFVTDMSAELVDPEQFKAGGEVSERIEPGIIEELPTGKDIKFPNPPSVEDFKDFTSILGHDISSGLGISYESLSNDLSEVNFSSARMGWLEMGRNIESWRNSVLIQLFLEKVTRDFVETYELKIGRSLEGLTWIHTPPHREMIDPAKEIGAMIKATRSGFISLSEQITAQGRDPEKVFEQIRADNEKLDELGLVLDTDPRKITVAGIKQADEVNENE